MKNNEPILTKSRLVSIVSFGKRITTMQQTYSKERWESVVNKHFLGNTEELEKYMLIYNNEAYCDFLLKSNPRVTVNQLANRLRKGGSAIWK